MVEGRHTDRSAFVHCDHHVAAITFSRKSSIDLHSTEIAERVSLNSTRNRRRGLWRIELNFKDRWTSVHFQNGNASDVSFIGCRAHMTWLISRHRSRGVRVRPPSKRLLAPKRVDAKCGV